MLEVGMSVRCQSWRSKELKSVTNLEPMRAMLVLFRDAFRRHERLISMVGCFFNLVKVGLHLCGPLNVCFHPLWS